MEKYSGHCVATVWPLRGHCVGHGVVMAWSMGVTCTLHVRSGRTNEDKYVPSVWPAWSGHAVQCFFTNQGEPHKSEAEKMLRRHFGCNASDDDS